MCVRVGSASVRSCVLKNKTKTQNNKYNNNKRKTENNKYNKNKRKTENNKYNKNKSKTENNKYNKNKSKIKGEQDVDTCGVTCEPCIILRK